VCCICSYIRFTHACELFPSGEAAPSWGTNIVVLFLHFFYYTSAGNSTSTNLKVFGMASESEEEITDEIETRCIDVICQKIDELKRLRVKLDQMKEGRHGDVFSESKLTDEVCSS
jgi:hypothetical protein